MRGVRGMELKYYVSAIKYENIKVIKYNDRSTNSSCGKRNISFLRNQAVMELCCL